MVMMGNGLHLMLNVI